MASQSTHTEPSGRPHTEDELAHPGRHHTAGTTASAIACPDPSAHKPSSKSKQQASSAAAFAASSPIKAGPTESVLDKDGNLSSKSAALSLKQARPEDLPSFPVVGISTDSSMSAALLANKNSTGFQHWKPDASASASKAALLASENRTKVDIWKPAMSAAGSKAALLAHKDGGKVDLWAPGASAEGNSAASQAMRKQNSQGGQRDAASQDRRDKALMAATGAVSKSRARAGSAPKKVPDAYPDASNSAHNALNAATTANRPKRQQSVIEAEREAEALEAARIQNIGQNVSREMWTERPPVELEREERTHSDALHASAVVMAKQMYAAQQKIERDRAARSAAAAVNRSSQHMAQSSTPDLRQQATQYLHLQEQAYKLAQERLAKMDPDGAARYREHYGVVQSPKSSRLSRRGRARRRGSEGSDSDSDPEDSFAARRIKSQMTQLNRQMQDTDMRKREQDRANVMAAAERRVQEQLASMDERVFNDTGKVSQAMQDQWEANARARAQRESSSRMQNVGKTYIGQGRFLDQAEIEAIAAARLKPTLDEITETANRRRQYDEQVKLQAEAQERAKISNKQNVQLEKVEIKRAKYESKMLEKQQKIDDKMAAKKEKLMQKQISKQQKEAEKERKKGVYKEKYLEKRSRSRSRSRRASKVYGTDVANASGHFGLGSRSSTSISRPEQGVSTDRADTDTGSIPPVPALKLDRTVSAMSEIGPDGKKRLQPELERQVKTVETSDSEDGKAEPSGTKQSKGEEPSRARTALDAASADAGHAPKSPIGRLFHKLTHRKKDTDTDVARTDNAKTEQAIEPAAEPAPAGMEAPKVPLIAPIDTAASDIESESSFQRHSAVPRSTRDDSSDTTSSDDEPERGRQGRRYRHRGRSSSDEEHEHAEDGILPSTKALVTGREPVAAVPDPAAIGQSEQSAQSAQSQGTTAPKGNPVQRSFSSTTGMSKATADEEFQEAQDTFDPQASHVHESTASEELTGASPGRSTKFKEVV